MTENEPIAFVEARAADEPTLWLMLTYAASMGAGGDTMVEQAKADAYLRCYVEGRGFRAGDVGIIARSGNGRDVGAAWLRLGGEGGSCKLGDDRIPELATAVLPDVRRRGVGTAMMTHLIRLARGKFPAVVLSVREVNPAVRFYARLGFQPIGGMRNRIGERSFMMRLDFPETGHLISQEPAAPSSPPRAGLDREARQEGVP